MSESPEESVVRLKAAQEDEETPEEEVSEFVDPGEYPLDETERLLLENLELKQQVYQQKLQALEFEMTGVVERIRGRLKADPDVDMRFTRQGTVHVLAKV